MDVRLVVAKGKTRTRTVHLRSAETVVGRLKGCDMRIPSAEVSRRHCLLRLKDGYVTVEDLRSVNGTFLNGDLVRGQQIVRPGDQLEIGPLTFIVEYEMTQATIDRLREEEEVDVLEEVEEAVELLPEEEEAVELLPEEEEAAAAAFQLGEADQWQMPDADQLRGILSQLDSSQLKSPKRPTERGPRSPEARG